MRLSSTKIKKERPLSRKDWWRCGADKRLQGGRGTWNSRDGGSDGGGGRGGDALPLSVDLIVAGEYTGVAPAELMMPLLEGGAAERLRACVWRKMWVFRRL